MNSLHILSRQTIEHAMRIRAVAFDSDGVLTDNTEMFGFGSDAIVKSRSHYDGQGISLLRAIGIHVAIITGETGPGAALIEHLVKRWNNLPSSINPTKPDGWKQVKLYTGCRDTKKVQALDEWLSSIGVSREDCAAMGDDLVDVPMLKAVGLRAAPSSAESEIIDMVDFVSKRPGGKGAVRDFANFILATRNLDPFDYPTS